MYSKTCLFHLLAEKLSKMGQKISKSHRVIDPNQGCWESIQVGCPGVAIRHRPGTRPSVPNLIKVYKQLGSKT